MGLEAFIDEAISISKQHGYNPTTFIRMRRDYNTVEAISRLVVSEKIQSGFRKMNELGLIEYTIESAVLKFPYEFKKPVRDCANWRLNEVKHDQL